MKQVKKQMICLKVKPLTIDFPFFLKKILYYAIKTIELMTGETVSFEEVFYRTKFLAFES